MGTVIAAIYNTLLAILNSGVARSWVMKMFVKAVLLVVIPLCLLKGFNYILAQVVAFHVAELGSVNPVEGISMSSMTGLCTYLYIQCGCNIAMASILSALSFKFIVRACQKGYGMLYYF